MDSLANFCAPNGDLDEGLFYRACASPRFHTAKVNSCLATSREARLLYLQKLPRRSPLLRTICIEFPGVGKLFHNVAIGETRAAAAMPGIAATGCGVHCFAAHASINSPLRCWVLDGERFRLQNVVSLALILR